MSTTIDLLNEARAHLLWCQAYLATNRRLQAMGYASNKAVVMAEKMFCKALDRAWDVQCMIVASF